MENPKLTNDLVFSYLMTSQGSEEVVKSFINATFEDSGRPLTSSVSILSRFAPSSFNSGKLSILDVKAQSVNGQYFNIEMQTVNKNGFNNRILYYGSKLYSDQLTVGEDYALLNPVVSIVVAQFVMFPKLSGMHNVFTLVSEKNPQVVFSDQLQIHSIELTKGKNMSATEISSSLQNWVEFLNNGHLKSEAELTELITDPGLAMAVEKYNSLRQDPQLRELALAREKAERDRRAELSYARNEGRAEGLSEGLAKGLSEGRAKSLKDAIVKRFTKRFPNGSVSELEQMLQSVSDEQTLNDIIDDIFDSSNEAELLEKIQQRLAN